MINFPIFVVCTYVFLYFIIFHFPLSFLQPHSHSGGICSYVRYGLAVLNTNVYVSRTPSQSVCMALGCLNQHSSVWKMHFTNRKYFILLYIFAIDDIDYIVISSSSHFPTKSFHFPCPYILAVFQSTNQRCPLYFLAKATAALPCLA